MSSCKITIVIVALSVISYAKLVGGDDVQEEEEELCPRICTCHTSHFAQLPLITMIHSDVKNFDFISKEETIEPSYKNRNEVLDEEDEKLNRFHHNNNPLMRMAVCLVKEENEIKEALQSLKTIEALTLLQSSDTENVTLSGNYFKKMKELKVLEIHGISQEKSNQNYVKIGNLYLKYDALSQIDTLEYINLQNVQLLGSQRLGNKIPPVSVYNYMNKKLESNQILPVIQPDYEQKVQRDSQLKLKLLLKNLVFLTPNEAETDIVPYEVYKEEQRAGIYSFAGLKNLKFLRVYKCNLTEINWEMFDGLHNLETLSLEDNNLLFIPEFAFYGTPRLKTLSLAHNRLLNIQYMSLAGLLQLQHIDLSYNNISHLSELSLPPLPRLVTADFTNNPLVIIFPSTFEIMNATQELHLGDANAVLDIQPNSFSGLRSLLKLTLKNVDMEILEREVFRGMPQLRLLKISGRIKSIAFDAFLDVPKLEKLILKNCSIEKLSMDSFYGLYNLRTLDLSHNLLSSLPPGLFDQQFSLKDLFLQHNNLTNLPAGFFANVPAKMIRLDGNPWHCSCAMKDWKPSVINQIKQKTKDITKCQFRFDKGSMCSLTNGEEYVYDKKVEPRCTTPKKFKGWGVFHLLHKELRCDKKQKIMKINRKAYLAQKMLDYEQMLQSYKKLYNNKRIKINSNNFDANSKLDKSINQNKNESFVVTNELPDNHLSKISSDVSIKLSSNTTNILESITNLSEKTGNYTSFNSGNITDTFNDQQNDLLKTNHQATEQKISKKEKEKLQLLQEKEERIRIKQKIKNSEKVDPSKLKKIMQADLESKRKEKLKMLNLKS